MQPNSLVSSSFDQGIYIGLMSDDLLADALSNELIYEAVATLPYSLADF